MTSTGGRMVNFRFITGGYQRSPVTSLKFRHSQKFCVNFILQKNSHGKIAVSIRPASREKVRK